MNPIEYIESLNAKSIVRFPNDRKTEIIHLDSIIQFGFPQEIQPLFGIQGLQNMLVMWPLSVALPC